MGWGGGRVKIMCQGQGLCAPEGWECTVWQACPLPLNACVTCAFCSGRACSHSQSWWLRCPSSLALHTACTAMLMQGLALQALSS